jgi:hypothetical protein
MSICAARPWHEGECPKTLCVQGYRTRVSRMGQLRTDPNSCRSGQQTNRRIPAGFIVEAAPVVRHPFSPGLTPALPYQRLAVHDGQLERASERSEDASELAVRRLARRIRLEPQPAARRAAPQREPVLDDVLRPWLHCTPAAAHVESLSKAAPTPIIKRVVERRVVRMTRRPVDCFRCRTSLLHQGFAHARRHWNGLPSRFQVAVKGTSCAAFSIIAATVSGWET